MTGAAGARLAAATAGALAVAFAGAPSEGATVRGLAIGIDEYVSLSDLEGAVADARDIHAALAEAGFEDLTLLENGEATRARIGAEWRSLLARAEPGDTLVLSYAGHGGQEPERVAGSEADGRDEVLLLGGFARSGPGTRERLFDDEINLWLLEAGKRGARVIFVADSCHSGTLTRKLDPRAPARVFRNAPPYTIDDDMLALDPPAGEPDAAGAEHPHVDFLAAAQEHQSVPEIAVPDENGTRRPRGALSWLFARAVRGEADSDGDGVLRRAELWRFIRENVRMASDAQQTPNLTPNRGEDEPVLRLGPAPEGEAAAGGDAPAPDPAVRLAVLGADAETLAAAREEARRMPERVEVVARRDSADLVWDARRRELVTRMGDVAARGAGLADLAGAVGKWRAARDIAALSARGPMRLRILPHDGLHREGSRVTVRLEGGVRGARPTLFDLSGNGVVHYLYPLPEDPPAGGSTEWAWEFEVTAPFGADHLVAVSAESSLDSLNAALARLDGRPAAREAAQLLAETAAGASGWSSGIQGLFTAPAEDGQ